jgi:hypothetical protein
MLSERKSDHRERTYAENERRTVENQFESHCKGGRRTVARRDAYLFERTG